MFTGFLRSWSLSSCREAMCASSLLVVTFPVHFLPLLLFSGRFCGELFFFFQAEDGIRDRDVTGVQTCALPIWEGGNLSLPNLQTNDCPFPNCKFTQLELSSRDCRFFRVLHSLCPCVGFGLLFKARSEERRVGKECRYRWSP